MSRRPTIDGIPLPDPEAIERQRRKEQPGIQPHIQPSVYDIHEEGYRRWQEDQQRRKPATGDRGVITIIIGGDDDEE